MIIWAAINFHSGGPTIIQNFDSVQECEAAIPKVITSYNNMPKHYTISIQAKCVAL